MKNISKLHLLFAMGIVFGSHGMMHAYEDSSYKEDCSKHMHTKKESKRKTVSDKKSYETSKTAKHHESGKTNMKKIEHEISQIIAQFKKDKDADLALSQLDIIAQKIKKDVAQMKNEEKHGKMWKVHQRTLERKLKEARKFIRNHSK